MFLWRFSVKLYVTQNIYKLWKKSELKEETMCSKACVTQKFVGKRGRHNPQIIQKRLYNHNLTKTDKGGVIVIVYVDDYVQEASQQLDNKDFYKKLTIDTTKSSRIKVNGTINEIKSSHLLDEKITNDLLSLEAKTPQFKMLPKFTQRETLADQWSVQNTLMTSYSHM